MFWFHVELVLLSWGYELLSFCPEYQILRRQNKSGDQLIFLSKTEKEGQKQPILLK